MKNSILKSCLAIAILFFATSCSDDNNDSLKSSPVLVKKHIFTESDGTTYSENIIYNGNKIVSITDEEGYVIKYTYTGDLITKREEIDENGELDSTTEFSYSNDKLATLIIKESGALSYWKIKFVHNSDGTVSYEDFRIDSVTGAEDDGGYVGKFKFKNGNLIENQYSYYGNDRLITYEYDANNNPTKNILGFNLLLDIEGDFNSANNVIKKINTSGANVYITTYTYKYDTEKYPTEETVTYLSGNSTSTETSQYFY